MTWHRFTRVVFFWAWIPLLAAFALIMRLDRRFQGTWAWYAAFPLLGVPFLVLDVLYNWIVGTIFWRELPREWTYTQRLSRLKERGEPEAYRQCQILNRYDPGHC